MKLNLKDWFRYRTVNKQITLIFIFSFSKLFSFSRFNFKLVFVISYFKTFPKIFADKNKKAIFLKLFYVAHFVFYPLFIFLKNLLWKHDKDEWFFLRQLPHFRNVISWQRSWQSMNFLLSQIP